MVNVPKLKGLMVEKGISQKQLASSIGINEKTLGRKLKTGKFNTDEMSKMIEILDIDKPIDIFFAKRLT